MAIISAPSLIGGNVQGPTPGTAHPGQYVTPSIVGGRLQTTAATTGLPPSFIGQGNLTPDQAVALANQYSDAAGLKNYNNAVWGDYWTQFGQNDPGYFQTKLLNGIAAAGGNMAPFSSLLGPSVPGGYGPGTAGYSGDGSSGSSSSDTSTSSGTGQDPYGTLLGGELNPAQMVQQALLSAQQQARRATATGRSTTIAGGFANVGAPTVKAPSLIGIKAA